MRLLYIIAFGLALFILSKEEIKEYKLSTSQIEKIEIMTAKAEEMITLKISYKWGGKKIITGLDCSGAMVIILRAAGYDPPHGSYNILEWARLLNDPVINEVILFFDANKDGRTDHGAYAPDSTGMYHSTRKKGFHFGILTDYYRKIEVEIR